MMIPSFRSVLFISHFVARFVKFELSALRNRGFRVFVALVLGMSNPGGVSHRSVHVCQLMSSPGHDKSSFRHKVQNHGYEYHLKGFDEVWLCHNVFCIMCKHVCCMRSPSSHLKGSLQASLHSKVEIVFAL